MRSFAVIILALSALTDAFVIHQNYLSHARHSSTSTSTQIKSSNDANEKGKPSEASQAAFLENEAKAGAEKIRKMSIEERTKRAMLAEAHEDRMVTLSDELEELLGEDGMPLKDEYREEVEALARQIKASQEQYSALVNGEESPLLNALNGPEEE